MEITLQYDTADPEQVRVARAITAIAETRAKPATNPPAASINLRALHYSIMEGARLDGRNVAVSYHDASGHKTERVVRVIRVGLNGSWWRVRDLSEQGDDQWRAFRLDRILDVVAL